MRTMSLRMLVITLLVGVMTFPTWSLASAKKSTCNPIPVTIDIKPGSYPNVINLSSMGVLPVAVLTTPDFDASQFTPEMAHLSDATTAMTTSCAGAMAIRWAWEDVNGDGQPDLVFFFNTQDLDLTTSSTAATLMAHGTYGGTVTHIMGTDSVQVLP